MQKRQNNEAGIESQTAKRSWKHWNNSKKAAREFGDLKLHKISRRQTTDNSLCPGFHKGAFALISWARPRWTIPGWCFIEQSLAEQPRPCPGSRSWTQLLFCCCLDTAHTEHTQSTRGCPTAELGHSHPPCHQAGGCSTPNWKLTQSLRSQEGIRSLTLAQVYDPALQHTPGPAVTKAGLL